MCKRTAGWACLQCLQYLLCVFPRLAERCWGGVCTEGVPTFGIRVALEGRGDAKVAQHHAAVCVHQDVGRLRRAKTC